jgi:TRAP transporter TAXI family solute receptor
MSANRLGSNWWSSIALATLAISALAGCGGGGGNGDGSGGGRRFVTLGTAPIGGAFRPVGDAISAVLNEHQGPIRWKVEPRGTKGSQQNIRELDSGDLQLAMSNSAITYFAVRGEDVWDKPYDLRVVVTLAPNVGLFITKKDTGIQSIADLAGKRVVVGPGGAGFHMFLGPLMTAHGVKYDDSGQSDFTPISGTYSDAVQLLGDGNADAAFMGGATPIPAVIQASRSYDIHFVTYDEAVRRQLIAQYPFYNDMVVPAKDREGNATYTGMTEDFVAMNVGSMHLITTAGQDEELIYQITKTIWENRAEIVEQHRAGLAINEQNAARYTGTEFHPGAIRFYQEIGIWPEDEGPAEDEAAQDQAAEESVEEPAED